MRKLNLMNQKFGKLTVIDSAPNNKHGSSCWLCRCECGNTITVVAHDLVSKHTQSCGCTRLEKVKNLNAKHRMSNTRIYKTWQDMKARCYNPNNKHYCDYGKRGIIVCDDWKNDFSAFYKWATENGYSDTLKIDRIDVNGNYEPTNCRWCDDYTQANNRRNSHYVTYHGETDTLDNMCRKLNINSKVIRGRLRNNTRTFEQAIDDFDYRPPFVEYWKRT